MWPEFQIKTNVKKMTKNEGEGRNDFFFSHLFKDAEMSTEVSMLTT